jgi:hypothetical protein
LCFPVDACPAGCYPSVTEEPDGAGSEPFCSNGIVQCVAGGLSWSSGTPANNCAGGPTTYLDGGAAPVGSFCCDDHPDGGADGATSDGSPGTDAEPSDMDASSPCDDLAAAAASQFGPIVGQNVACGEDTDCVWTASDQGGDCVAVCGWLSNEAGVGPVQSAANRLCQPFLAQGCTAPAVSCPYFGPFICAGGTCASYTFDLTPYPLPTITHGVCAALQLNFSPSAGSPDAPHSLVVSMTASNGLLYSDTACTTPLTTGSLTIPAGSSGVAFGFTPSAPGNCLLEVGPDDRTYGVIAQ